MKLKDFNLTKEELVEIAETYMNETFKRYDFIADESHDMFLYDENNNKYLDFLGGIAVNSVGGCNQRVIDAINEQASQMIHASNYFYTVPQTLLAKLICETIGMDKIQFQNSGAEANEAMIKLARKYGNEKKGPGKNVILTAYNSFHGRTLATLSATGQPGSAIHKGFEPLVEGFRYAEFNNLKSFEDAVTDDVVAIMVEPVQGEGGVYPATREFLQGLRKLCDDKKLLLLFDEVQTGWGRTGAVMSYMNYDIKPDAVTMAKAMGGGMPIAAMCATNEAMQSLSAGSHGTTFGGNPVCCAASYAAVSEIIDKNLSENAKEMGAYFSDKLRKLPHVSEVRGMGLLVGLVLDGDFAAEVKHDAFDRKLLMSVVKPNVIRMVPPLIVTKEEIDMACEIIGSILSER
ncbi:MAG: acetylornithine/succinylornithine family transaminase [Eubacterium sp.]|nr:acetylornithine/succinylornithine family transaminase [Eubacterium sp.]